MQNINRTCFVRISLNNMKVDLFPGTELTSISSAAAAFTSSPLFHVFDTYFPLDIKYSPRSHTSFESFKIPLTSCLSRVSCSSFNSASRSFIFVLSALLNFGVPGSIPCASSPRHVILWRLLDWCRRESDLITPTPCF